MLDLRRFSCQLWTQQGDEQCVSAASAARGRRRWLGVMVLAGLVTAALVACAAPTQSGPSTAPAARSSGAATTGVSSGAAPSAPAAPAAPLPLKKLPVAMPGPGMTYLPHRIALVEGFYREFGYDAEIQIMQHPVSLASLGAGQLPFVDAGGSGIRAAGGGLPVRMVECHGTRPIYGITLGPGLSAAAELEGKGFAVGDLGSDNLFISRDLIRKYGGDPGRIEFHGLGASNVRYAAVTTGRVAGAVLSATETVLARESGLLVLNTAADLPLACNNGIVVTTAAITERPEDIRNIIGAVQKAVLYMQNERAGSIRILAEWQDVDERQAALAYDVTEVQLTYSIDKATGQQAVENALAFAKEVGQVEPNIQFADVANFSLLP